MNILQEADQITSQDRNDVYGHPADDFDRTAQIATALGFTRAGQPLAPADVAVFQLAVKLSRLANSPDHRDTLVDLAGYARTIEMVMDRQKNLP